jgi:hypothetical protein
MAYKYFTELLIDKNLVNLSEIFPEKQKMAQDRSQVSYNLGDVVIYLQDVTNDFKNSDNKYIDLDNAIREIIVKYYKSIGIDKNPIEAQDKEISEYESNVPREAFTVEDGKIKGKGVPKPAPKKIGIDKNPIEAQDKEISEYESNVPIEAFTVEDGKIKGKGVPKPAPKKMSIIDEKINQYEGRLEKLQGIFDDIYNEQEKAEQIQLLRNKLSEDEIMAEDGDEYFIRRIEILKDFINKNS